MPEILRRLGHEVIDAPIPTDQNGCILHDLPQVTLDRELNKLPLFQQLRDADLIICFCIEYYVPWLHELYPEWKSLRNRVAIAGESSDRLDYSVIVNLADHWFFPDPADALRYHGEFIPCCVDTEMFRFHPEIKQYDVAFLGTLYQKRLQFLQALGPHLDKVGIQMTCGEVVVHDLTGECHYLWANLNSQNICRMKVHLALPGNNSKMVSTRHFETLACGTFLLTYPILDKSLKDGIHCKFYSPDDLDGLTNLIRYYLDHDEEREQIAIAGHDHVHENYSATKVLKTVLDKLYISKVVSA